MRPATPPRSRPSLRRLERLTLGEVAPHDRAPLVAETYALWSSFFSDVDLAEFERTTYTPETRLVLARGAGGVLAAFGFLNARVVPLPTGRSVLLVTGGLMSRLDYRGSGPLAVTLLYEALRARLRHRSLPAYGISRAANPMSYALSDRFIPEFYPRPNVTPPPEVDALIRADAAARDMVLKPGTQWVSPLGARAAQAERLRSSRTYLRGGPSIAWYESVNPGWADGDVLCCCMPFDLSNVARTMWSLARDRGLAGLRGRR